MKIHLTLTTQGHNAQEPAQDKRMPVETIQNAAAIQYLGALGAWNAIDLPGQCGQAPLFRRLAEALNNAFRIARG